MNTLFDHTIKLKLASNRLEFRPIELADAPDILEIRSNKDVMKFMDSEHHISLSDSEKFVQTNIQTQSEQNGFFWAIIDRDSQKMIGDFSFWQIDHKNKRAQIGYTLKPNYWGKAIMCETMSTLLNFGFNELQLHSFEANINPLNEASKKCLVKKGFKKEAYFRENYYYNGQFLDSEIYCLLQKDLA